MNEELIRHQVRDILHANLSEGYSDLLHEHYCYIKPSPGTYPFQWWWDTCFEVFMLCDLGEYDLARRNMRSLFAMQRPDGFVGHMIFWKSALPRNKMNVLQARPTLKQLRPHMSSLIQPPLVAQATLRIYKANKDRQFLETMLPKLKKYYHWLIHNRCFDGDVLVTIITTFESGLDWCPAFDPVVGFYHGLANRELYWRVISVDFRNFLHRYDLEAIHKADYFQVKGVAFNTIYAEDLQALATLCDLIGDRDAESYRQRSQQVAQRILELMYDEKTTAFYDVYGHKNRKSKILTFTTFFPTALDGIPGDIAEEVIRRHLLNEQEFTAPFPIPSVSKSNPSFFPYQTRFLWRGPTWVLANWFLYHCLLWRNFDDEAEQVFQTVGRLIEKSGFREYYNPFSGAGYGARQFTWSGLIVDMMRIREEVKQKRSTQTQTTRNFL
jgi:glycogen debranching enzyme